jgi:DnaJ-class molecular chaperone
MALQNHYSLLGISHTATERGIQRAFRALAKHYHPDRLGPQSTAMFQELVAAYETLVDAQRRRDYDAQLLQTEDTALHWPVPQPARALPCPEPLIPEPLSIAHDFGTVHPSWEALRDRLLRNFTGRGVPKGDTPTSLTVQVQLTPDEARRGGVLHIGVPVFRPCTLCAGSGRDWGWPCQACREQGMVEDEDVVAIRIPPQVPQGMVLEIPLRGLGIANFYLCVHVQVTAWV